MMNARWVVCCVVICGLVCISGSPPAVGQVMPGVGSEGISVHGTGEASERPNVVEIDLTVSGKAELTGDALVKYRDAKKRVLEALEKLKLAKMSVDERGLSISVGNSAEQQQRFNNGMPQTPGKPQVEVSSTLRIKLIDVRDVPPEDLIKTVGRLMDVAQDSGVNVGPSAAEVMRAMRYGQMPNNNAPVRFVLTDLAALREKAYEKAVSDARARAERLAKLHHLKLGQALSIQEVLVSGDQSSSPMVRDYSGNYQPAAPEAATEPRIATNTLAGVPVQVKLLVRFAIQPADPATAQK